MEYLFDFNIANKIKYVTKEIIIKQARWTTNLTGAVPSKRGATYSSTWRSSATARL
jgi:hypothetical protein